MNINDLFDLLVRVNSSSLVSIHLFLVETIVKDGNLCRGQNMFGLVSPSHDVILLELSFYVTFELVIKQRNLLPDLLEFLFVIQWNRFP